MLKKFSVTNYRQFNNKLKFDLTASNYNFNKNCVKNDIVKLALIYGENGTGKSTLGWAMFDLISHLTDNNFNVLPAHYLNASSIEPYASFKFEFVFKKKTVIYQYQKDENRRIVSEHLSIDEQTVIDYKLNQPFIVKLEGAENLNKNINPSQNLSVLKYIFSNTNLDKRKSNNKIFVELMEFINHMLWFRNVLEEKSYIGYRQGSGNISEAIIKNNKLDDFEKFLREFGLDFKLVKITDINGTQICIKYTGKKKPLPFFEVISTGTKNLVLFYHWWQELRDGKIPLLFIDEFDCSYHFALSKKIVEKLRDLPNTQIILTTHNTDLLSNDLIRPDCGYVIDGGKIESLNHLTQKELREAHNLEKLYHAGAFNG